nr:hypothetical protein [Tanacetum cinerariifolium]
AAIHLALVAVLNSERHFIFAISIGIAYIQQAKQPPARAEKERIRWRAVASKYNLGLLLIKPVKDSVLVGHERVGGTCKQLLRARRENLLANGIRPLVAVKISGYGQLT